MDAIVYKRPQSLDAARAALAEPGARVIAGGTDLIVQLRERRRAARVLVDLKHVPELTGLDDAEDGSLVIGSAASASALSQDQRLVTRYPALATSLGMIGSKQIQNRATLGGNICNAAPSADAVPPLICYRARCTVVGPSGPRSLAIEDLFERPGRTRLADDEILRSISLPPSRPLSAATYQRFTPRREMDIAVVGVGAWIAVDENNRITDARIALASVAPKPMRAGAAEQQLIGSAAGDTAFRAGAEAAAEAATPISDTRGSADYRRDLVHTLTLRTLRHSLNVIKGQ